MDRHNFISSNEEFKNKVLYCYDEMIEDTSQLDIYAEESIYKKFISSSDNLLIKKFQKSDWKTNLT